VNSVALPPAPANALTTLSIVFLAPIPGLSPVVIPTHLRNQSTGWSNIGSGFGDYSAPKAFSKPEAKSFSCSTIIGYWTSSAPRTCSYLPDGKCCLRGVVASMYSLGYLMNISSSRFLPVQKSSSLHIKGDCITLRLECHNQWLIGLGNTRCKDSDKFTIIYSFPIERWIPWMICQFSELV